MLLETSSLLTCVYHGKGIATRMCASSSANVNWRVTTHGGSYDGHEAQCTCIPNVTQLRLSWLHYSRLQWWVPCTTCGWKHWYGEVAKLKVLSGNFWLPQEPILLEGKMRKVFSAAGKVHVSSWNWWPKNLLAISELFSGGKTTTVAHGDIEPISTGIITTNFNMADKAK